MKKRIFAIILTIALSVAVWVAVDGVIHGAQAENNKCPDGKTCYLAKHEQTGKVTCRHNANKPWQWLLDDDGNKQECGKGDKKDEATKTPKPIVITYTPVPKDPTSTPQPEQKPTNTPFEPKPTKTKPDSTVSGGDKSPTRTATATVVVGVQLQSVATPECPWCAIFTNIMFAEQTQAAAQSTMAAK